MQTNADYVYLYIQITHTQSGQYRVAVSCLKERSEAHGRKHARKNGFFTSGEQEDLMFLRFIGSFTVVSTLVIYSSM